VKAFQLEQRYSFPAADIADATSKWEQLDEAAEALGFFGEDGACGEMKAEDIASDSPLAKALEEYEARHAGEGK